MIGNYLLDGILGYWMDAEVANPINQLQKQK